MSRDFWSRRRAAVEAESQAQAQALSEAELAAQEAALAAREDDEILAELELPAPETLETPEAVRNFLKSALPMRLRNRALRQLWGMNPTLANLDGLVDYGEDFTDSATVVANMQTIYEVGRGMVKRALDLPEEDAPEAEALVAEAEGEPEVLAALDEEAEELADELAGAAEDAVPGEGTAPDVADQRSQESEFADAPEPMPAPSRRMRFSFAQDAGVERTA
ncbi:DUF3306 domain-containing protein [Roseovarius nubinhibens]|uniref:DUF3306 domain-containing protein n=1 Tax=Roseovarius nubinhibens TaxID=314263 RepID=A0A348WCV5_9RHOB|nr:DUF3306 domain-containing protein [Roseovarius nubinhibens]|tara:strand:- start:64 stop:726 length:663 start_codon:yes stop_codon:yes gene_type:complete